MRPTTRTGLLIVNVALLLALGMVVLSSRAGAEGQPGRPRGEYVMVSGRVQGAPSNAIYILDTVNQELLAVRWNAGNKRLVGVGYRNLAADMQAANAGGGR